MTTERIDIVVREDGSRVVKRNLSDIGTSADSAASSLDAMRNILAGLVAGGVLAGLMRMADAYTTIQNRLRLVTTGTENLARVTKELQGIANSTRTDFEATSELYSRLASSAKELGTSQEQLLRFTKTLNQAIVLSGATAEEAAGGLRQLSQGMASGVLRGDELNSVMENFPKVADIIAQGMGITRGELRKMGAEGKITATTIIDAFAAAEKTVNEDFGSTIPTISQSFTVLKNNLLIAIGEFDQATGISARFAQSLLLISNNLDTILPVIAGLATSISVAFAIGPITSFANALKALYAVAMANPWLALATVLAGVVVSLTLLRDEIKLGIDDTTTLGDLMRAAWEDIGPMITAAADLAASFFGWLSDTGVGTFNELINSLAGYEHESEAMWLRLLRIVVQVFDMIGGTIRGVMSASAMVVAHVITNIGKNFATLGDSIQSALSGDFAGAMDKINSNVNVFEGAGEVFGKAFQSEILNQADSGLESMLDSWVDRAAKIGREREAAARQLGDLNPGTPVNTPTVVDEKAAAKAARELARLQGALEGVLDAANPVEAATRRLAEAQDILNKGVAAGLIGTKAAAEAYDNLKEQMRDQLDPLGALNRMLDENISLLKLGSEQRQIEADLLDFTAQLRRDGIKLTSDETAALRAKLVVEQELARIAQARDSLEAGSIEGQMREFQAQVEAMKQLMADASSGFGAGDIAGGLSSMLPWANLEGTKEQMDSYVALHASMYEQIKALEDASIINSNTAGMLRNQADQQLLEQRLSYTRQFFGALAGLSSSENKKLAAIGKAAAITQATIDGVLAVQKTMANTAYPYNIPLAAAQAALAAANVAQIASTGFRTGGSMVVGGSGGPDSQTVAFRATPGERVQVNTPSQARALEEGGKAQDVTVPVTIVNVDDPQRAVDAMDTAAGKSVIMNHMQSDPAAFKRALGMS